MESLDGAQGMKQLGPIHCAHCRAGKFFCPDMVDSKIDYPQAGCHSCKNKVRTYCMCSPGVLRCDDCFAQHVFDAETGSDNPGL